MTVKVCVRLLPNSVGRSQPGDFISIVGPTHVFSAAERNCGQYRFLDVTDATESQVAQFAATKADAEGRILAFRAAGIDWAILDGLIGAGGTTVTKAQLQAAAVLR